MRETGLGQKKRGKATENDCEKRGRKKRNERKEKEKERRV